MEPKEEKDTQKVKIISNKRVTRSQKEKVNQILSACKKKEKKVKASKVLATKKKDFCKPLPKSLKNEVESEKVEVMEEVLDSNNVSKVPVMTHFINTDQKLSKINSNMLKILKIKKLIYKVAKNIYK